MISGSHVDPLTRHSPALRSTGRIKRYKQGKVIAKGKLYVRQTQRVRMKDNQENKELNEKSRHTKEYLRKTKI